MSRVTRKKRYEWSKFWWKDWQNDLALKSCSYAARGLWMEMLAIMHAADRIGFFEISGKKVSAKQLAGLTNGSDREVRKLLVELEENGVFSVDEEGFIFSRRMVRDKENSDISTEHGRKGGNPALVHNDAENDGEGVNPPVKGQDKPRDKLKKLEARNTPIVPLPGDEFFDDAEQPSDPKPKTRRASSAAPDEAAFEQFWAAYFSQLCQKYGGNQTLACAAYNAGPGRVDQWVKDIGDPRTGGISDADFVAAIPFDETRNYVSRAGSAQSAPNDPPFDALEEGVQVEPFLRATWQALASGVHESANGSDWLSGFKGASNIAKKASQNRSLIFKDADGWLRYNSKFGQGHVIDSVMTGIERGARNAAVMESMGTNPVAMFNHVVDQQVSKAKDRNDFKMSDKLRTLRDGNLLGVVTGQSTAPANKTVAQIGAYMRTWNQLTKLGGVMISSLPDIAVTASVARHNGVPLLEAYWREIQSLAPNWASKGARNKRQVAQMLGVGIQGHLGAIMNRFASEDAPLGRLSRAVNAFHKWNGLQYWTDSLAEGLGLMLTHNLGRNAGKSFDRLHPKLQQSLRRYGLDAGDWEAIRGSAKEAADGATHILPAELTHLDDAAVSHLVKPGQTADNVRNSLQTRLSSYITDQVREGMTEPDPRTQAMIRGSYSAMDHVNPVLGQAMRMLMQFKTFPLTHIRRVWGREVQRNGPDVAGIVHLIAATTALGYIAMSLKSIMVGKEPQNPADWRTVMAAMVQGGGAGIYGDFLFGEQSRMGNSFLETLAGPTFSDFSRWAKIYNNTRDTALNSPDAPKGRTFLANIVQQASGEIPGGNLFYANAALKYLVFYRLQEMINPGYLQRYERNMEQNQGQKFWLSPTWNPYRAMGAN